MAQRNKALNRGETILLGETLAKINITKPISDEEKFTQWVYEISHTWSQRHPERASTHLSKDAIIHGFGPEAIRGNERGEQLAHALHDCFEDFQFIIEDIISVGSPKNGKVSYRYKAQGIFAKPLFGAEPSNKFEYVEGMCISVVKDGKQMEAWVFNNIATSPALGVGIDNASRMLNK